MEKRSLLLDRNFPFCDQLFITSFNSDKTDWNDVSIYVSNNFIRKGNLKFDKGFTTNRGKVKKVQSLQKKLNQVSNSTPFQLNCLFSSIPCFV